MKRSVTIGAVITLWLIWAEKTPGQADLTRPQMDHFRFERAIVPGGAGPNRLAVDVTVLAGAAPFTRLLTHRPGGGEETYIQAADGLSDLRIYDSTNREVPYLLVDPPTLEPKWIRGTLLEVAATKKTSGFEIDLAAPALVDRLRLFDLPRPFLKRFLLEGSGDRTHWTMLVAEGTLFDLPDEKLKKTDVEFAPGEYRYLRVLWDDRFSGRVPLPGAVEARFVSSGTPGLPLRAQLEFERRVSEPGISRYRIRVPGSHLPIVALELTTSAEHVMRGAQVAEARLSGGEVVPHVLGSALLKRAVRSGAAASDLRIPIDPPSEPQLELVIADDNNPPLDPDTISAVFAYVPWIYFESQGNEPLTARFGYANLAKPHYDLEAVADSAARVRCADAHWSDLRQARAESENPAGIAGISYGAVIDLSEFGYARDIPAGKRGLNAIVLDAAVLAHSNLNDLRIAGPDRRQVPYLLENTEQPVILDMPALEKTDAPRRLRKNEVAGTQTRYRLKLPFSTFPASHVVLTTPARVFQRVIRITVPAPNPERQASWSSQTTWIHTDPETAASPLTLQVPALTADALILEIEEGDNSPLPISSVKILLPGHRVRFFREDSASLTLYYGRHDLDAPKYDIALLAPRLVGAAADEISLVGPERAMTPASAKTTEIQMKYFWAILIIAVIILFGLIARLIKTPPDPEKKSDA